MRVKAMSSVTVVLMMLMTSVGCQDAARMEPAALCEGMSRIAGSQSLAEPCARVTPSLVIVLPEPPGNGADTDTWRSYYDAKAHAIRDLGSTTGTNHVDLLIRELAYDDPNRLTYPAVDALVNKGSNAIPALVAFILGADINEKRAAIAIQNAGFALEAIIGRGQYMNMVGQMRPDISLEKLQLLVARDYPL